METPRAPPAAAPPGDGGVAVLILITFPSEINSDTSVKPERAPRWETVNIS